jgi:hypothetical protein
LSTVLQESIKAKVPLLFPLFYLSHNELGWHYNAKLAMLFDHQRQIFQKSIERIDLYVGRRVFLEEDVYD